MRLRLVLVALLGLAASGAATAVVVKDGLVFDSFTGPAGLPIDAYLAQFEYADAIALVAR
jgi:hypothetical protein